MTLFEKLKLASSEEDVKDVYIKAIGLKGVHLGTIDIQTKEIWFEAKVGGKISTYAMFTQLLHYVQDALNKGEYVPPFLCVIDSVKAAIMKTSIVLPFLEKKTIKWGRSASSYTPEALEVVSAFIGTHFVSFRIETHETEFIETIRNAIKSGEIIRTPIRPDNLKQVFDKWVDMIGCEINDVATDDYALLFFADIMSDGTVSTHDNLPAELLHRGNKPTFLLNGHLYELGNQEGYRQFWQIYDRPPKEEYRNYLLERRDSLIPTDERSFKGAYYTPLQVVDTAYDKLYEALGADWQKEYIVWDMCCGVGNLEVKHSNPRNLYMSTLDEADIDVMKATKTCVSAQRFQYDYLNDDINDNGEIDYTITNKIPDKLRTAIANNRKILILINPPYAEAASSENVSKGVGTDKSKIGVAKTRWGQYGMNEYGQASNELFTQFVTRIHKEIPNATLAMFSKLKYINSQTMVKFRNEWRAVYLGGFVIHSKVFDGVKGNFPIGFLIWKQNRRADVISTITTTVFDKKVNPIGEKEYYNISNDRLLTKWILRPKPNKQEVIPLKNCITPATAFKDLRGTKWSDDALAYIWCNSNDIQSAPLTALFSSGYNGGHGIYVNPNNLWQVAIVYTVRRVVKQTWLNDRDQFLQPTEELTEEFKNDCLVWMLFNGSNLTASANDLEWDSRQWSIVNHFIPFTEQEVNATDRFESDFMVQYLNGKTISAEAQSVLDEGRKLWQAYFADTDSHSVRKQLFLNRSDVGWYQIRQALKLRNESSDCIPVSFTDFETTYCALSDKIRPMVYELGFLK